MIAYGLVGGNIDKVTGDRIPMTVQEMVDLYMETIPEVFQKIDPTERSKSWKDYLYDLASKANDKYNILPIPLTPYSQKPLEKALRKKFGHTRTYEIATKNCFAGAVVREFNEDAQAPDVLRIFDAQNSHHDVTDVLLASSDAPIFFEIPRQIGDKKFIDGGVLGNCGINEAIPRALDIFGPNAKILSVLSVAPPHKMPDKKLVEITSQLEKFGYTLKYLISQLTDGSSIYKDARNKNPATHFSRISHMSKKASSFELDEKDVDLMLEVVQEELATSSAYLRQIFDAAAIIASRTITELTQETVSMFEEIAVSMRSRREFEQSIFVSNQVLEQLNENVPRFFTSGIESSFCKFSTQSEGTTTFLS